MPGRLWIHLPARWNDPNVTSPISVHSRHDGTGRYAKLEEGCDPDLAHPFSAPNPTAPHHTE